MPIASKVVKTKIYGSLSQHQTPAPVLLTDSLSISTVKPLEHVAELSRTAGKICRRHVFLLSQMHGAAKCMVPGFDVLLLLI